MDWHRILMLFFAGALVLITGACEIKKEVKNEELSYDLTVNGCATGKQSFSSLEAYCSGLQNDALNNGCARSTREQLFYQNCSGTF
jgi:hypothetical protein